MSRLPACVETDRDTGGFGFGLLALVVGVACAEDEPVWLEVMWELVPLEPVAPLVGGVAGAVGVAGPGPAGAVTPPVEGAASAAGPAAPSRPSATATAVSMCLGNVIGSVRVAPAPWNTGGTANVADTSATGRVAAGTL